MKFGLMLCLVLSLGAMGCQTGDQSSEGGGIVGVESPAPAPTATPQAETTTVNIDSTSTSFQENQAAPFTAVVSGLTSPPRFDWYIDGQRIPDTAQAIQGIFPFAGSHIVEVYIYDDQNRLVGSARRVIDVLAAPLAPLPEPTPTPTPTTAPVPVTFTPSCPVTNVNAFKTSANNLLAKSQSGYSFQRSAASIDPICPGSTGLTATPTLLELNTTFLDSTMPQQTITEISVKGISPTWGIFLTCVYCSRTPPLYSCHSWAFHYYADLNIQGQTIALGRLIQDPFDPTRFRVNPNFTAALKGAVLNIRAVLHEATENCYFSYTLAPSTVVKEQAGGIQLESHTIFIGTFQ